MIRQAFTELKDEIDSGKDFVIIARKPCSDMDYEQLKKSLIHALHRSGVKLAKSSEIRGK
jgi:ribonuclease P protein component